MGDGALTKIKKLYGEAIAFFDEQGIERTNDSQRPWFLRFAHFWLLVGISFVRNRCPVRASALAYSTLLALIPMLAVVLSISASVLKSRGEEPIRQFIDKLVETIAPYTSADAKKIALNPDAMFSSGAQHLAAVKREEAVQKINEFINNTRSGAIGVTGTIALVAVAISMLMRIEATFNDIWGVTRSRSWYTQVLIYWATISLAPVLLIIALGLTGGQHFQATKGLLLEMPFVGGLLFKFLPIAVLCFVFAMLYQLMPNTPVRPAAAFAGGAVAAALWYLNNLLGVNFVSRVTSNNAIYGSLGMIPIFMIGLYLGWLILLFGGQVAYAFQNRQAYLQEKLAESVTQRGREFIALRLMTHVALQFHRGTLPPTIDQLAAALSVPSKLISQLVQTLEHARLLIEAGNHANGLTPARPLEQITAHHILQALRAGQGQEPVTTDDALRRIVRGEFDRIGDAERAVAGNVTMKELVERSN